MQLAILGGSPVRKRPFTVWPEFGEEEAQSLDAVLRSRNWGGYSEKVRELEERFAELHRVEHAIACSNGTVALEVALRAAGVTCGDEVIVTPYSFIASASTILICHGVPVFADIDPNTLNISPDAFEAAITPRTKAAVVVHFGGHPADMDAIMEIARRHKIAIIEDSAHAHGARWRGTPVGNFGVAGTFSFQAFKLATAGEGGIVVTNDRDIADRVWAYCNQGRRRGGGWFEHYTVGSNYRLTGFQAAVLVEQVSKMMAQTVIRTENADYLRAKLRNLPGLSTGPVDARVQDHPQYLMTLRYDGGAFCGVSRQTFIKAIEAEGIPLKPTYPHPLYRNPLFRNSAPQCCASSHRPDYESLLLPNAEQACKDGLWLEHNLFLGSREDMDDIVAAFEKVHSLCEHLRNIEGEISNPVSARV